MNIYHAANDSNMRSTARYFGVSTGLVSENLKLARNHNLIKDCKSRNVALKLIKK